MPLDIVRQIYNHWVNDKMETHSASCWQYHASCAIALLCREIEYLEHDIQFAEFYSKAGKVELDRQSDE